MTDITLIQKEINTQVSKPEVLQALVSTTFKGLEVQTVKRAMMEGMMRGFTFEDFLKKNIYAIPFRDGYSLVTSVDYARKQGMKGGVVGTSAPVYEETEDGKIISCEVTVKRLVSGIVGEYTAKVYFNEYSTGKNLWVSKPRTMIAKVAEMHALRKACPDELSQAYAEEEVEVEKVVTPAVDLTSYEQKLKATKNIAELKKVWADMPIEAKLKLEGLKADLKTAYENA